MPLRLPIVSKFDDRGINDARSGLDRLGGFAKNAGALLAGAFAAGTVAVGAFTVSSIRAADESWKVSKALEQAAKNAGVFGSTEADITKATDALKDHAQKLGELTGIDDEVLLSMEKTWMSVPTLAGLGTEGIQNLAKVAADVAAGTGKDIESIGGAFVKVAGDGETAMSKLLRAGIVFTDEQKNTYQAMLDANDEIGAQTYLIDQLGTKYAGMAEAAASPLDRITQMWQNFQETIGTALMPALEKLAPMIGGALATMVAKPEFQQFLIDMSDAVIQLLPSITDLLPPFMELVQALLPGVIAIMPGVIAVIQFLADMFKSTGNEGKGFGDMMGFVSGAMIWLTGAIQNVIVWFNEQKKAMESGRPSIFMLIDTVGSLATAFFAVQEGIKGVIDWWNSLWGVQQSKPVGGISVQDYRPGGLKLASGGIVMPRPGGTMATIGEGGQAEAVIPLNRLNSMMGGGGGGGSVYNVNISTLKADASVGEIIVNAIKKYERTSGAVFVGA